jgi:nicotinate-nucleotide pyrophosphorylase (carboxylating)
MTNAQAQVEIGARREALLRVALFRGGELRLENPSYLEAARAILGELVRADIGAGDLTAQALGLGDGNATARVLAKEPGVLAGLAEYSWLLTRQGIRVTPRKKDGDAISAGETMAEISGTRGDLLAFERVGLNLLQRMSGIATATRALQELADRGSPRAGGNSGAHVVATRKTPWGLLDKRAVHLGGGGTHRLSLPDAILVKNNHLALLGDEEAAAARDAIRRVWPFRRQAGFIEIEVRGRDSALAAARAFREVQQQECEGDSVPCLLMLDNTSPEETARIVIALRGADLLEGVLIEASGNISEQNVEAYAASGVDAISVGALTHSARALDLCQRLC